MTPQPNKKECCEKCAGIHAIDSSPACALPACHCHSQPSQEWEGELTEKLWGYFHKQVEQEEITDFIHSLLLTSRTQHEAELVEQYKPIRIVGGEEITKQRCVLMIEIPEEVSEDFEIFYKKLSPHNSPRQ